MLEYSEHLLELQCRTRNVLRRENLDGLVIHSGQEIKIFLDDQHYPFKVNPHFKHWLPLTDVGNSWLIVNGEDKPTLVLYQPVDFWHAKEDLTTQFWQPFFEIKIIEKASDIEQYLPYDKQALVYIGSHIEVAQALGFKHINTEAVLNYLHFHRGYKTQYEQTCLRQANEISAKGHQAAKQAFEHNYSEFVIQQAYLQAISQSSEQTPYQNIVALNEHAAVLHYNRLASETPLEHRTLLIDAGAGFYGYGADITRTYTIDNKSLFANLITDVNQVGLELVGKLKPGTSYIELHQHCHLLLSQLLIRHNIIIVSLDAALACQLSQYFFPHGLGHHLGLQTHDVGGFMQDERGTQINPPTQHPFLRTTRMIEAEQVFTIEPGIYFIPSLLTKLKASAQSNMINWPLIEQLIPYGGIRIEDNIIVHQLNNENITRAHLN